MSIASLTCPRLPPWQRIIIDFHQTSFMGMQSVQVYRVPSSEGPLTFSLTFSLMLFSPSPNSYWVSLWTCVLWVTLDGTIVYVHEQRTNTQYMCPLLFFAAPLSAGGGHWEDVTTCWSMSWAQAIRGSSPSPLSLEYGFHLPFLFPEVTPRTHPWERGWCWDHLDGIGDWIPSRPLYKHLRFGRWMWRSTCLAAA